VALTSANERGELPSFNNFNADCHDLSERLVDRDRLDRIDLPGDFNGATLGTIWTSSPMCPLACRSQRRPGEPDDGGGRSYASLPTPSPGACTYNPYTPPGATTPP
jgi:hypothetical protein